MRIDQIKLRHKLIRGRVEVQNEKRPLFADLGELAQAITNGIRNAQSQGVKAKAVHVNPKMKEILDSLAGYTVKTIGDYPVLANELVPIDKFAIEKAA